MIDEDEKRLRQIARSDGVVVTSTTPATADVVGHDTTVGTIPDDMVRKYYRIILNNPNNSPVSVTFYKGDATDTDRDALWGPSATPVPILIPTYSTLVVGENIKAPVAFIRPDTSETTTQENRLYATVSANSMNVVVDYYDEKA